MVIAGSNTFYMKIEDKTSSLLPAGIVVSLGDIHRRALFDIHLRDELTFSDIYENRNVIGLV